MAKIQVGDRVRHLTSGKFGTVQVAPTYENYAFGQRGKRYDPRTRVIMDDGVPLVCECDRLEVVHKEVAK